ncbi:hypothetical protein B0H63DRAFT_488701 [Podospora didyma]|uniref:Ubiquitin 3 binding protein But2 C-terminal domain-containing protein n=1 Tax=Podospora didyma TaxID=330526 RepID=A0AAE0K2T2_9PEZI|nr:hypothetical protein B0H63DRAFT_488701 [Podospora didyma]
MAKLAVFLAGLVALFAASAASAANPIEPRQCTTTIQAPFDSVQFDMFHPGAPGRSWAPFVEAALNADAEGTGYRNLLRFNPPSTGTCSWVLSLPADQLAAGRLVIQGKPLFAPVLLAFYGVEPGTYQPGDTLADFTIKPGPFGVNAIQPGTQVIHAEPCAQIGGELFLRIPEWITEAQWVFWRQDILPGNVTNSLGIYMQIQQC